MAGKQYKITTEALEKKLAKVMERLGVEKYNYDWAMSQGGGSCFVEMVYGGSVYRFENSSQKAAEHGRKLTYVSDIFATVVYSLEGLARAVEQGIFTLDMLLVGVPALPAAQPLEPCFAALGFTERPKTSEEVRQQYRQMAKVLHPDAAGGSEAAFQALTENYNACLNLMEER